MLTAVVCAPEPTIVSVALPLLQVPFQALSPDFCRHKTSVLALRHFASLVALLVFLAPAELLVLQEPAAVVADTVILVTANVYTDAAAFAVAGTTVDVDTVGEHAAFDDAGIGVAELVVGAEAAPVYLSREMVVSGLVLVA